MHKFSQGLGEKRLAVLFILIIFVVSHDMSDLSNFFTQPASCTVIPPPTFDNKTVVDKPGQPVFIDEGQIPVGSAWAYIYNLKEGVNYHIYLLGDWADPDDHITDYDIFVYRFSGLTANFVSSHTESAGLTEQVGNDGYGRYFMPSRTADYTFYVRNDPSESSADEAGTLMVIEHIELNQWYSRFMKGKKNEEPVKDTTWAYEFNSSSDRIRVFVDVPSSLDMYEARLYVMANPDAKKGELVNGVPVAWEPGLRGERSAAYGGFNFDPQGYRNVGAMASCEHSGEDMVIDYKAPAKGNLLYHLVLIAEYFSGTVDFIVQTDFEPPKLQLIDPPAIIESGETTTLKIEVQDETPIESLTLSYSTDESSNWKSLEVSEEQPGIYNGMIPALEGGVTVDYMFEAEDSVGNIDEVRGNYIVKNSSQLQLHLEDEKIMGGDTVKAYGYLNHGGENIEINYTKDDTAANFTVSTDSSGYFNHAFTPKSTGEWQVTAKFAGDNASHPARSETLSFTVNSRQTSLSCTLNKDECELGEETTISGDFSIEIEGIKVVISLATADNVTKTSIKTSADGSYRTKFKPDSKGEWKIQATVQGDGYRYEGAESKAEVLTVLKPKLTTIILRIPSLLLKPPYLYGLIGVIGGTSGVAFYLWRRE